MTNLIVLLLPLISLGLMYQMNFATGSKIGGVFKGLESSGAEYVLNATVTSGVKLDANDKKSKSVIDGHTDISKLGADTETFEDYSRYLSKYRRRSRELSLGKNAVENLEKSLTKTTPPTPPRHPPPHEPPRTNRKNYRTIHVHVPCTKHKKNGKSQIHVPKKPQIKMAGRGFQNSRIHANENVVSIDDGNKRGSINGQPLQKPLVVPPPTPPPYKAKKIRKHYKVPCKKNKGKKSSENKTWAKKPIPK